MSGTNLAQRGISRKLGLAGQLNNKTDYSAGTTAAQPRFNVLISFDNLIIPNKLKIVDQKAFDRLPESAGSASNTSIG